MSLTSFGEARPSLAWDFESSNVDYVTGLAPSSQVSPGPGQLVGGASLVTTVAGVSNTAISFDGTSGAYMNLGATGPTTFDTTTSNTFVEAWVYFNALAGNSRIYGHYFNPTNNGDYNIRASGAGLGFTNGTVVVGHQTSLQTGVWTHVAFSLMTNGTANVFVNGVVNSTGGPITVGYTSTHLTLIGGGSGSLTNGYIRDLRVVQGGVVPTTTFTPGSAPFSYASPGYVANMGTTVFTLLGQFVTYNPSGKYGSSLVVLNPKAGGSNIANIYFAWDSTITSNLYSPGLTVAHWIKFASFPQGANDISSIWTLGDAYFKQWNGAIQSGMYNGVGYNGTYAGISQTIGTWYHYVSVYGNGNITTYVNGSQVNTNTYPNARNVTNSRLFLGSDYYAPYNNPTSAEYDDFRIYNTALTAAQVQSIYQAQGKPSRALAVTSADLLLYAPFNGTTTDSISSVVPTLTGSVSYDSVNAKYTQSLIVTNTPGAYATNYLEYPKTIDIAETGLTCAFWVRTGTDVSTAQTMVSFRGQAQFQGQIRYELATSKINMSYWNGKSGGGAASAQVYQVGPVLSTNTWYHLAIAIKPNGNISFYVNAVEYSAGQNCGLRDIGPTRSIVNSFFVGTSAVNPNYQNAFSGEFDDLRLYNYALETPAITSLYNTASPANFIPPSITLTGAPLFNQLSQSATSSAVGAFSLRAVNGVSTRAVQVQAHPVVQWPPTAMTSNATVVSGQAYGNGTYYATESTGASNTSGTASFTMFDNNINTYYEQKYDGLPPSYYYSSYFYINGTSNVLNSPTTTVSGASVLGWWVQIQSPTSFILRNYTIVGRQNNNFWITRMPSTFWIAGSNDGATWSNVHYQTGVTFAPQSGLNFPLPFTSNSVPYSYYRMIVSVIGSGAGNTSDILNIASWNLYGDAPSYAPNAAQDFYADERGNLLTAPVVGMTLRNWLGGATGYVTKWYDQSGRGNDASQATAANQPIIQRATKGPGYMCLYSGTQGLNFGAYDLLNNKNYTTCGVVRRTAVPAVTNYYLCGDGGVNNTDQKFHSGYRTSTLLTLAHYADDANLTVPSFLTSSTEPTAYNYLMLGSGLSGRLYSYSSGTLYSTTRTYTGYLNHAVETSFSIGGGFGTFIGEIYELLVFTQSLYDLDGTISINQIYNSQVGYTGT